MPSVAYLEIEPIAQQLSEFATAVMEDTVQALSNGQPAAPGRTADRITELVKSIAIQHTEALAIYQRDIAEQRINLAEADVKDVLRKSKEAIMGEVKLAIADRTILAAQIDGILQQGVG